MVLRGKRVAGVQNVTACDVLGDELGLVDHKPISHSLRLGFNSVHMVSKVVQYAIYDNLFIYTKMQFGASQY